MKIFRKSWLSADDKKVWYPVGEELNWTVMPCVSSTRCIPDHVFFQHFILNTFQCNTAGLMMVTVTLVNTDVVHISGILSCYDGHMCWGAKWYENPAKDMEVMHLKQILHLTLSFNIHTWIIYGQHGHYDGHLCQVTCKWGKRCGSYALETDIPFDLGHTYRPGS